MTRRHTLLPLLPFPAGRRRISSRRYHTAAVACSALRASRAVAGRKVCRWVVHDAGGSGTLIFGFDIGRARGLRLRARGFGGGRRHRDNISVVAGMFLPYSLFTLLHLSVVKNGAHRRAQAYYLASVLRGHRMNMRHSAGTHLPTNCTPAGVEPGDVTGLAGLRAFLLVHGAAARFGRSLDA